MWGEQESVFFYGVTVSWYGSSITIDDDWLCKMKIDHGPVRVQKGVQCGHWFGKIVHMKSSEDGLKFSGEKEVLEKIKKEVDDFAKMPIWEENGLVWDKEYTIYDDYEEEDKEANPKFGVGLFYRHEHKIVGKQVIKPPPGCTIPNTDYEWN